MKAIKIFYDNAGNIITTVGLEGNGVYPYETKEYLKMLPAGVKCVELIDQLDINSFLASDSNYISDDKVVIGIPRPTFIQIPPRDLVKDVDSILFRLRVANIP